MAHAAANAALIAEVKDAIHHVQRQPDQFALAGIARQRRQATIRLEGDRDLAAWKTTMERLDREEKDARATVNVIPTLAEVAETLGNIRSLFEDATPTTTPL